MDVIDPGHDYLLATLDGEAGKMFELRFVKRIGDNYPGNCGQPYCGTTLQEVLRALIDRARYLNRQIPCAEAEAGIGLLEAALVLFEIRAKRVKGKTLDAMKVADVIGGAICPTCAHVMCHEHS